MASLSKKLAERIELAKLGNGDRNCIGTALYLISEEEKDEYIPTRSVMASRMDKIPEPKIGTLAVWSYRSGFIFREEVMHMGVVTGFNSLNYPLITHRPRRGFSLVENQPCGEISEEYGRPAKFYVPKR